MKYYQEKSKTWWFIIEFSGFYYGDLRVIYLTLSLLKFENETFMLLWDNTK